MKSFSRSNVFTLASDKSLVDVQQQGRKQCVYMHRTRSSIALFFVGTNINNLGMVHCSMEGLVIWRVENLHPCHQNVIINARMQSIGQSK